MTEEHVIALLQMQAAQVALLVEIRDLVRDAILSEAPTTDELFVAGCQHPEDSRVEMSTPGDVNHWICRDCRFDNKAVA